MEEFNETQQNIAHKKKIQWSHIAICIIILSIFFIILSIILNKDEQEFLFNKNKIASFFQDSSQKVVTFFDNLKNNAEQIGKSKKSEDKSIVKTENNENSNAISNSATNQTDISNMVQTPTENVNETNIVAQNIENTVNNGNSENIENNNNNNNSTTSNLTDEQYDKIIHIYSKSPDKTVYLTFDDGPSPNVTPLILDELKKENVKATFFVLGSNATYYPEIVKRAYSEGHFIGNHGYSHKYSEIYQNTDTVLNDYTMCEKALQKALGDNNYSSKVYRFPGGSVGGAYDSIKKEAILKLKENKIAYLDWNSLTYDAENAHTKELILKNVENTVAGKKVVVLLMHDSSSKILTYETLSDVIKFLRDKGYTFRTLYDIL